MLIVDNSSMVNGLFLKIITLTLFAEAIITVRSNRPIPHRIKYIFKQQNTFSSMMFNNCTLRFLLAD